MALSFHYHGRLREAIMLPELIEEVEDICNIIGWKTKVFLAEFPEKTFINPANEENYGIVFFPDATEPISLTMDSTGKLCNVWLRKMFDDKKSGEIKVITVKLNLDEDDPDPQISEDLKPFDADDFIYQISVKNTSPDHTSYVKVLELIRYLSEKYFDPFSLKDESDYWETRNTDKLKDKMYVVNNFLEVFGEMMQNHDIKDPKDFLKFIKLLSRHIKNHKDDDL